MGIKTKAKKTRKPHSPETCVRGSLQSYINFGHDLEKRDVVRIAKKCGTSERKVRDLWAALSEGKPIVGDSGAIDDPIAEGIRDSFSGFSKTDFFKFFFSIP